MAQPKSARSSCAGLPTNLRNLGLRKYPWNNSWPVDRLNNLSGSCGNTSRTLRSIKYVRSISLFILLEKVRKVVGWGFRREWFRPEPLLGGDELFIIQGRMHRMPRQRRAFHAYRKVAHAGKNL